jgi:large subunit ribosomal protein L5
MKTRLEEHYLTAVRPALMEKFGYANVMQAPKT